VAIRPDLPEGEKREVLEIKEYCGKQDGVFFLDCDENDLHKRLADIAKDLNQSNFDKIRFITPLKGDARSDGALSINEMFYEKLAAGRQPERDGFALYEPVLWNENDYDLELMNGTLGFVSGVADGLEVAWEGGHQKMDSNDNMERAYAINCHRCQGSQFERVIIPIYKSRILDSTMLYTAVTRAQRQVVLVGDKEAFWEAVIASSIVSHRRTGLQLRL
jgi:exodeoxyribonuclease V alpha subunit